MSAPAVSVIMSIYNGERYVPDAVRSILEQTFRDFELIAIDNGSTEDNTLETLRSLEAEVKDDRLRVVHLPENIGLAGALNHGIGLARGHFIARQDHDDLSKLSRLEAQVQYMEKNPECGLLGTRAEIWEGEKPTNRHHDHPEDNATLQFDLLFNNPFVHTSVIMRREALDNVGLYTTDPARQPPEDYELWSRISRKYRVANLPDRLAVYREFPNSMSRVGANPFQETLIVISAENLAWSNGLTAPDSNCLDAAALAHAGYGHLSARANIESIVAVVRGAAETIIEQNPGRDLSSRLSAVEASLRHHFAMAKLKKKWFSPVLPHLKKISVPTTLRQKIKERLL